MRRKNILFLIALLAAGAARAQRTADASPAPSPAMPDMAPAGAMDMDDDARFAMFRLDEFERDLGDGSATHWNAQGWYGGDFDKFWLRSEGDLADGRTDGRIEAFRDHAFAAWWDWQLGARYDLANGMPGRGWAAFGVQGMAPYWFAVEATAYLGTDGRTAGYLRVEYDLLLTQRLILQPEIEANLYGRQDRARAMAAGLSDAQIGLRLRYEIRRKFAPYIGVERSYRRRLDTPFFPPTPGETGTRLIVGLNAWF